ncbi:MAG: methyltransferase domain-containing protein [Rudaea sp.]|nr:methyltransferase domain-containing protein [Rudaea sp.]
MPNRSSQLRASSFYSRAPIQALFARELHALAPILSGIYGNSGLFLRAHAAAPATLPPHLLGNMVNLTLAESRFDGDVRCAPAELPFANETFKLLIAQHVFEQIDLPEQSAADIARVLAPEGVALILGFNPAGSWRPWLALNVARGTPRLHLRSASAWQQMLSHEQVDTLQVRYPGTLWPHAEPGRLQADESMPFASLLGRIGSSWLLLARKRRSTLTPLRLRSTQRDLALGPRLAPGAHRACA